MKTHFYNRTGYSLLSVEIPRCFTELDEYFGLVFQAEKDAFFHPSVALVENLCRRMADIELYAQYMEDAQKGDNLFKAAILIGTLLVGYFASCKSLLDAGAITLATIYSLTLPDREKDFSKKKFWKQLETVGISVCGRYTKFQKLFNEIIVCRDAALHRITPLAIVHSPGEPGKTPLEKQKVMVVAKPDADYATIVKTPTNIQWVNPLHYHGKWQGELIKFCGEICLDIKGQTISSQ
jgi:hypothetical protein